MKSMPRKTESSRPAAALSLAVQYACEDPALPTRSRIRRWVRASCAAPAEVTVRFVDADEGRMLNHEYRGKDYPTNVLSFPYAREPVVLGDLVVCPPVVLREAGEQGKAPLAHFAHLIVHGMLHLQGHDHETGAADADRMEALEREIMAALGFPDPY